LEVVCSAYLSSAAHIDLLLMERVPVEPTRHRRLVRHERHQDCLVNGSGLEALLRQHASSHSVPGAAVGILRDGVAATAYFGVADVTSGEPVTPETHFSVGSLTKSMVATVIARLAAEGRLSLDDPVAAHVPELRGSVWAERATLHDLLANRSGLPLRAGLEFGFDARKDEGDAALSRLAADVPRDVPRADFWSYANVGWCLLGRTIETITHATWEEAMRRYLASAGMHETTFALDAVPKRRASGHEVTADGPVPVAPLISRAYGPAGIGVLSTVTDLLGFAAWHLEDPALAELRAVQADNSIYGWLDSWCLGWASFDWEGGQVWGWDGLVPGERAVLRIVPERRAALVLMTNSDTGRAMYRSLFADLTEALFGLGIPPLRLAPSPGAAGDLSRFAGVYAWPDRRVDVTANLNSLLITDEGGETEALPLDECTFLVDARDPDTPTLTFGAFDAAGRPHVLYLMLWGLPRVTP
jgi:CubicO group peptidase (beta-lactamase class C family)